MPTMNREQIMEIIPHRDPMLLIDEVTAMEPGQSVSAKFYVDPARDIFKGHFPGAPVFPGVYTTECMAQAADILLLSMERYKNTTPLFIGIDKVRFKNKIEPGDTIEIHAKLSTERQDKAIATCSAEVFVRGELAASGEVTLAMR
ncbi:MAG: 3-hydroxyacyl-ACP dehydratase FabZ [Spirochaetes bacterium]|nr:3-hydroxyacyl-ACP dehydratase FabZ [Spirochaetota bacterium]